MTMRETQTPGVSAADRRALQQLSLKLHHRFQLQLFDYKEKWFLRRLSGRIRATASVDIPGYLEYVEKNPSELSKLLDTLAINISSFFRNPEVFEVIRKHVFGDWKESFQKGNRRTFYAWSCPCAHGEEPYSLAILWQLWTHQNFGEKNAAVPRLRIASSDIDSSAVKSAKDAIYKASEIRHLREAEKAFFVELEDGMVQPAAEIRKMVTFNVQNLLNTHPAARYDLIMCRNFMIFLNRDQQEKIFDLLYGSLREGGFLALGRVEGITGEKKHQFTSVHPAYRVFRKADK